MIAPTSVLPCPDIWRWLSAATPDTASDAPAQTSRQREEESALALRIYRDQDPAAIEQLYDRYYERILNYLYRRTYSRELAEDLTSETFLRVFQAFGRMSRPVWVGPWIYRTATNVHLSHVRRLSTMARSVAEASRRLFHLAPARPDHIVAGSQNQALIRQCMQKLPEKYLAVLLLRFDEELSHAEIAEALNLSPATVRKHQERALHRLHGILLEMQERSGSNHD